jgi:exoribonuclease R
MEIVRVWRELRRSSTRQRRTPRRRLHPSRKHREKSRANRNPQEGKRQLARWAKEGKVLHVLFHRGFVTTVGTFRVHTPSKGDFILIDEKTQELHVIDLEQPLEIELREEKGFCSITLWDAHQQVEIGEVRGTAEDALRRYTSNLVQ